MQYFCSKYTNTNQTKSSNVVDDRPLIMRIFKCCNPKTNKTCDALYAHKILKYNPEKTTSKERIWARNTIEQYKEYKQIEECKLYGKIYTPLPKNNEICYSSKEIMLMMKEDVKLLDKLKLYYRDRDVDTNLKGCYTNLKAEIEHYSKQDLEQYYQGGKEQREQEQRQQEERKQEQRSHYQRQQEEFLQEQQQRQQEERKRKEEHEQKILMEQEQDQILFVMKSLKKHTLTKEQINQIEELEKDYKQRQLEKNEKMK